jgi:circadian clock protein KaiB
MQRLLLKLYVAGDGPNSAAARSNLRQMLASMDPTAYAVEVIDCMDDPMRALEEGVLVTPTMVRCEPQPQVTVIGSLSDAARVRDALGLPQPDSGNGASQTANSEIRA